MKWIKKYNPVIIFAYVEDTQQSDYYNQVGENNYQHLIWIFLISLQYLA